MYCVYWTEVNEPKSQKFESNEMKNALNLCEALRTRKYSGENVSFITMSSENPDSVGKQGVAEPSPDYDWKKRRI